MAHRRQEIERILDEIVDPCSVAAGTTIGLVQMGIIDRLELAEDAVTVWLLPTFPGCLYSGVFANEITKRLTELGWYTDIRVEISVGGAIWDEDRMSSSARERLDAARNNNRKRVTVLR
jgi:metal-sulfur cluster biosynthetic enzyme